MDVVVEATAGKVLSMFLHTAGVQLESGKESLPYHDHI